MRRRSFLEGAGVATPSIQLLLQAAGSGAAESGKFTAIPLDGRFNASARDFGPRPIARLLNGPASQDDLVHVLGGEQQINGIPFRLGPAGVDSKSWVVLSTQPNAWRAPSVAIPVGRTANFVCLAHFCDWDSAQVDPKDVDDAEKVGEKLADAVLVYDDGSERVSPVRRRFEVNPPGGSWVQQVCFNALPSNTYRAASIDEPLNRGTDWGYLQYGVLAHNPSRAMLWICALENPAPDRSLKELRLRANSEAYYVFCGLTLYHGRQNPLRRERRRLYRITLPSATAGQPNRWKVDVDLGAVCRTFTSHEFQADEWLKGSTAGLSVRPESTESHSYLHVEVTSNSEAALTLHDTATGAQYQFDLASIEPGRELPARQGNLRIELLEAHKTWLRGRVVDASTGRTAPVRLAFRSKDGRYIPPYGHRTEVNVGWFQDYGADAQVGESSCAYVDGTFQVELPVGEVYVEIGKGFEYEAVRQRLQIAPGQRDLELLIPRMTDWRKKGWVTADTHVHFLSPSTAVLEAQAEGLNLVNLLAAQWGDLFTNVGDLPYGHLLSPDKQTMVALGTENRQHLMGHLGLLGGHGEPVFPMSADGPLEAYLGDPLWSSMSDWADACRQREGLVVGVHFPNPNGEMAAEIVMGRVDAVELYPRGQAAFNWLGYHDWYRYLNCGYRLAAAGGTDKMDARTPVGGNRTYAYLAGQEFNFANWAAAVRAGRTFTTTGPLLDFRADGHMPGHEIRLRDGNGTLEVMVEATSYVPFHRLEVVLNGRVVASREDAGGTRQMKLAEKVSVRGSGWLAARCASRVTPARFGVCAHTSPVYLVVPGRDLFSPTAAAYFLKLIEGAQVYVEQLAIRPERDRLERIASVLKEAHARLHGRIHRHGG